MAECRSWPVWLQALPAVPPPLAAYRLDLSSNGNELTYTYDTQSEETNIVALLDDLDKVGIRFKDLKTTQSWVEDIFVSLVTERR